jgi:hypothetical protein
VTRSTRLVPDCGVGGWWWRSVEGGPVSHLCDEGDVVDSPIEFYRLSVYVTVVEPAHEY